MQSDARKLIAAATASLAAAFLAAPEARAAAVQLDLTGTVMSDPAPTSSWAGTEGGAVGASLLIDLDANKAEASRSFNEQGVPTPLDNPTGEIPTTEWAFEIPPYSASVSGALGSVSTSSSPTRPLVFVRTRDDVNPDWYGNIFGLMNNDPQNPDYLDVMSILVGWTLVDCSNGILVDPWGCSDEDAPEIGGTIYEIFLIGPSDWFDHGTLPTEIPQLDPEVPFRAFGLAQGISPGASAQMEYTTLFVQSVMAVPALGPAGIAILGGLLGLAAMRRLSGTGAAPRPTRGFERRT